MNEREIEDFFDYLIEEISKGDVEKIAAWTEIVDKMEENDSLSRGHARQARAYLARARQR